MRRHNQRFRSLVNDIILNINRSLQHNVKMQLSYIDVLKATCIELIKDMLHFVICCMKCVQICVILYNFRIDKFQNHYVLLPQVRHPSGKFCLQRCHLKHVGNKIAIPPCLCCIVSIRIRVSVKRKAEIENRTRISLS